MDPRRITVLLILISVALLGLIGIQVKWMRDSMALREAQFDRSVDHALFSVSDRLEQLEMVRDLQRSRAGRRLLQRFEALNGEHSEPGAMEQRTPVALDTGLEANDRLNMAVDGGTEDPAFVGHQDENAAMHGAEYQAMIAEMVRSIFSRELVDDIRQRINVQMLDSLLRLELHANQVPGEFEFGIFTAAGTEVELGLGHLLSDEQENGHVHKERLFRHDLTGTAHFLYVRIQGPRGLFWRELLPLLLTSALFMAIIVVAFLFTIRTIFRQKRIGEIRNDLVNNLTHELKTPISTIGLACEALADPSMPKTEQQVRTFVAMIRDENKRLGSLVENVLQSAVLESGHMVLKRVDLDVHALVQDVVRSSSMQVSRRNGRIDQDLSAEIHHVSGDRIHLTNLLYNLIDNAVKYTEQEPRIRIATSSNDEGITVSVTDNGIGIAPSEQRKIFDRLYRVPTGNIHNAKGFGLGLSYVRTVVERHSGRIKVESAPGRGSTFHIFIPFEHVRTAQTAGGGR